jgi:hypothetical protein
MTSAVYIGPLPYSAQYVSGTDIRIKISKRCPCVQLSTTPCRIVREWRYSSTVLDLGNTRR